MGKTDSSETGRHRTGGYNSNLAIGVILPKLSNLIAQAMYHHPVQSPRPGEDSAPNFDHQSPATIEKTSPILKLFHTPRIPSCVKNAH
jgi:hypothetical protein